MKPHVNVVVLIGLVTASVASAAAQGGAPAALARKTDVMIPAGDPFCGSSASTTISSQRTWLSIQLASINKPESRTSTSTYLRSAITISSTFSRKTATP